MSEYIHRIKHKNKMNPQTHSYTTIEINTLTLNMYVGLLDHEKTQKQRVQISAKLYTSIDYLNTATENTIIDYGAICEQITDLENDTHIELLETISQKIFTIIFAYQSVQSADLKIIKPDIIDTANGVGLNMHITRDDYTKHFA